MHQKNSRLYTLILGITLFSMFFGSGNLIFPPYMGYEAGSSTLAGLIGFAITAILFPVLGVLVICRTGSLMNLAEKAGHKFALVFTIIVFLALGPGLAIPRNAAVSFEMAVVPFMDEIPLWVRIVYSLIFFAVSLWMSLYPEKLSDTLGKVLGPILLVMMMTIVALCFIRIPADFLPASGDYASQPVIHGFMDGYNTMDTLAALNFGNIIMLNVRSHGIEDDRSIASYTRKAGWIAGILLFAVYACLAFAGALGGSQFSGISNGAGVLSALVYRLFGNTGVILLGILFVLSCMTTCVGLLCSCSEFFASITKISYRKWVLLFTLSGFAFSIVGLDELLKISVPFLTFIYPIAMVLVILGLLQNKLARFSKVFPTAILFTCIASAFAALHSLGIDIPYLTDAVLHLGPTADLCWLIPSAAGVLLGMALSSRKKDESSSADNKLAADIKS